MSTMFFFVLIVCTCTVIHGSILGEQNKDVIFPCSFKPGDEVVIHWNTGDDRNVHSYYYNIDQLKDQDKSYAGRTSLFLNEISRGNASLKIKELKKSDENTYKCYVGTKAEKEEHDIILQVIGPILGEQNKDVTLPCSFKPGEDVVIHWTIGDNKYVHSYYKTTDQLLNQEKDYDGRTSLFLNEISKGNASLQIKKLKKNDENTYKCYVGTKAGHMENKTILQIIDLQYKMEYNWENGRISLTCSVTAPSSEDIKITWYENDQKVQEDQSTNSTYPVRNNSLKYQCTVLHSNVQSSWTGTWTMKEPIKKKDDSITCGQNVCEDEDNDCYLSQEANEGLKVIMNRSLLNEDHNLMLSNLSANDNGCYICTIKTEQKMTIEITLVNITAEKGQSRKHYLSIAAVLLVLIVGITFNFVKKKPINRKSQTKAVQCQESYNAVRDIDNATNTSGETTVNCS